MAITPLPAAPEPTDSTAQFNTKAFAWVAALDTFTTQANALETNVDGLESSTQVFAGQASNSASQAAASATASANSATTALGHASAAAANTNAPLWVSGTTYAAGALVYSALDGRTYRRKTAGAGTTNPVSDSTNWTPLLLEISTLRPTIRPSLLLDFANSKRLDSRITFSRASTATYYGTRTAKAEENLLLQSQTFTNGVWLKGATTVLDNNTTSPDGTTTASSAIPTAVSGQHYVYQNAVVGASIGTISFYVKANGYTKVFIGDIGAGSLSATYDLTAVTATVGTGCTATIASVGNGWYRITATSTANFGTKSICISSYPTGATLDNFAPQFTGDGTSGVFLWGAQLEQRSTVTAYQVTTTQPVTNYIPVLETAASGVPRFDHNPISGDSLGFLVEQQSTNLVTYSSEFDNAAWNKVNATITANTLVAPDGTLTADTITATTNNGYATKSGFSSASSTLSLYVKQGFGTFFTLATNGNSSADVVKYNLSTGVVVTLGANNVSASITSVGNGWYRLVATRGATAGTAIFVGYLDSGASVNDYHYIWGAQLEALAFPTSYIATVASQVTRAADAASMTGTNFSSWFNNAEGTVYVETALITNPSGSSPRSVFISDNTTNNYIGIDATSSTNYRFLVNVSNVLQSNINFTVSSTTQSNKLIVTYKINDFANSANGGTVGTDTLGTIPVVNRIDIGSGVSSNYITGTIKKLAYYPIRLSNTNLQALTG